MNNKELLLASTMLKEASEEYGCHGCNDFEFPDNWTKDDKLNFCRDMYKNDIDLDEEMKEYEGDEGDHLIENPPDFAVMEHLSKLLLDSAKAQKTSEANKPMIKRGH